MSRMPVHRNQGRAKTVREAARVPPTLIPAEARIPARGSDHGGGVLVFAKDGYLCTLEAYSHDGEPIRTWPAPQLMTFTVPR